MFKKTRQKITPAILATGLGLTLVMTILYIYQPLFFRLLDNRLYDQILSRTHNHQVSGVPVIIDLDDDSLTRSGQWPWPRYRVALLLAKLRQAGVLAVGSDILFSEADRSSPQVIKADLKRDLQVEVDFSGLPPALLDNDQVLAGVLADGPYVLGYYFNFAASASAAPPDTLVPPLNVTLINTPGAPSPHRFLLQAAGIVPPLTKLITAAPDAGFFNTMTDEDGTVRRSPLLLSWQEQLYPSLSMATLRTALGKPPVVLKTSSGGIESLRIASTVVPLDSNGRMLVHYRGGRGCFQYIPAIDVLEDKLPPGSLQGRIALIGTSAAGLKDLRSTPLDPLMPGVEVHATIIDNILTGDFFSRPDWAPGLELCLIIFCGLITSVLIAITNARWTLPVTGLSGFAIWQGGLWFMATPKIFISPLFPLLTLVVNFSFLTLMKFRRTEKEKLFFRTAFSRYVSKSLVDQIVDSPEKLSLAGEEKELTIMFTDIRGFSALSEKLTPTEVIDLLHDYFTPMTKAVTNNLGTMDKFIGDAIMAFWNAPVDIPDHKVLAVRSGVEMLSALGELNKKFREKYGFEVNMGIGLHTGKVRVGNIGTDELFDYTVIGDNVNLTSRLEGLTKFYGVRIVMSETLIDSLPKEFTCQELDMVQVKGRETPLKIYGLFSTQPDKHKSGELEIYNEALRQYRERNFAEAARMFSDLRNNFLDRRLYSLYEERCHHFQEDPPPPDWDFVYSHTSK